MIAAIYARKPTDQNRTLPWMALVVWVMWVSHAGIPWTPADQFDDGWWQWLRYRDGRTALERCQFYRQEFLRTMPNAKVVCLPAPATPDDKDRPK